MSSSFVGTTRTLILESSVEMTRGSSERTEFFSSSILTPNHASSLQMAERKVSEFSPMPAEKAMVSKPCMDWAISAISWEVR